MNPLVILSGGKDALLARETFVTDLYIYIYIYTYIYTRFQKRCNFKVHMIYMCLLFSHQKGVDRKKTIGGHFYKRKEQ